jgi:hypothetical protein
MRHWNHSFAGAHDFPKFVNGGAAMEHELRKWAPVCDDEEKATKEVESLPYIASLRGVT